MNRHPKRRPLSNGRAERPIKDLRTCLGDFVIPARNRLLRQILSRKPKDELIDALFDIVHLPDLLDHFKDDIERYSNGGF